MSRATASGVPPSRAIRSSVGRELRRRLAALVGDPAHDRVAGALAQPGAVEVDAAHARLRGERDEARVVRRRARARAGRTAWPARRSSGPRASRRPARRAARPRRARASATPGIGTNARLAVAERDRAGLVEQQDVDVAGRLDRAAGEREHVAAHEPVHARDADRRQQRADRRRDERDEQRDERRRPTRGVREVARTGAA